MSALISVCDIITEWMDLDDDQVFVWDQKINIPDDDKIYIAVSVLSTKVFGNTRKFLPSTNVEEISTNIQDILMIDIMSRNKDARTRKEEVLMALNSTLAERTQAEESFRVFPLSKNFINLSEIDGAAIPYRFQITVALQYFVSKTKTIDYWDTFDDVEVTTEP